MGFRSGPRRALGAVALLAALAGCGGSVTDKDSRGAAPATTRSLTQGGPFCAAVQANSDALRPLNGLALRGVVPADQLTATVEAARISGTALLDAAPNDIRLDVQRTVDSLNLELNALIAAGGDASAAARDPRVMAEFNSAEVAAANQRVTRYVSQNCS